jgi:hypothetical protein
MSSVEQNAVEHFRLANSACPFLNIVVVFLCSMPGIQLASYWEGDRAEIFAQYVLSAIAAVVRVQRQVDFGFDFLCTLVHRQDSILYTGMSFGVQVKAPSTAETKYGGFDKHGKWKDYELDWLYSQSRPFLLCVADIKALEIRLYNTSRIWWVKSRCSAPAEVMLVPDETESRVWGEALCPRTPLENSHAGAGDGFSYRVPLGAPIIRISLSDPKIDRDSITSCLNQWLELAHRNILHHRNGVGYFEDILQYTRNEPSASVSSYQFFTYADVDRIRRILLAMTPGIESLMRNLIAQNKSDELGNVIPLASLAKVYGAHFWSQADKLIEEFDRKTKS